MSEPRGTGLRRRPIELFPVLGITPDAVGVIPGRAVSAHLAEISIPTKAVGPAASKARRQSGGRKSPSPSSSKPRSFAKKPLLIWNETDGYSVFVPAQRPGCLLARRAGSGRKTPAWAVLYRPSPGRDGAESINRALAKDKPYSTTSACKPPRRFPTTRYRENPHCQLHRSKQQHQPCRQRPRACYRRG